MTPQFHQIQIILNYTENKESGLPFFWRGGGEVGGGGVKAGRLGVREEGGVEECCFVF